jgi:hypothetical protein
MAGCAGCPMFIGTEVGIIPFERRTDSVCLGLKLWAISRPTKNHHLQQQTIGLF